MTIEFFRKFADMITESNNADAQERKKYGDIINKRFGKIYDYPHTDRALDYLDDNAELYSELFDKHDGELDDIIKFEPVEVLKQLAIELDTVSKNLAYDLGESIDEANTNKDGKPFYVYFKQQGGRGIPASYELIKTCTSKEEAETEARAYNAKHGHKNNRSSIDRAVVRVAKAPAKWPRETPTDG